MKVLLIGSGGREHALALGLSQDPAVTQLHIAPGNPGMSHLGTLHASDSSNAAILTLAESLHIDLVVIGPELPLVNGVADELREAGIAVFGPSRAAAQLEGSKEFAKQVMNAAGVPTARSFYCTNQSEVATALDTFGAPYVVKHDGLAAGKGVVVTHDREVALAHAALSHTIVIEEYLDGPEVSLFGISDGERIIPMQPAQDFKRAYDNDAGPNTGGMGAYSPLAWAPVDIEATVLRDVLLPTVREMAARGTPFVGLLYAGLALTSQGIKVIEFNARFGDPETEVLIPRLKTPLGALLYRAATGALVEGERLEWSADSAVTVVLAADGYPAAPVTGGAITLPASGEFTIFHAGTKVENGSLVSAGGRVLTVTGMGPTIEAARTSAYAGISEIELAGSHFRRDIALGK